MPCLGPVALGRGVVIADGVTCAGEVHAAWAGVPNHAVDEAVLAHPEPTVQELHQAWSRRLPVVVRLAVDLVRLRSPASWAVEPWAVRVGFEPWLDRLHFWVWANNYDAGGTARHVVAGPQGTASRGPCPQRGGGRRRPGGRAGAR